MVWFQKFEYAVGHWLQKTTEHVLGCVLCSPGCFSLFRGAAIVDVNVMHQYVTLATEARHYVQWDQGLHCHNKCFSKDLILRIEYTKHLLHKESIKEKTKRSYIEHKS